MKISQFSYLIFLFYVGVAFTQNTPEEYLELYESRIQLERINDVYIPMDLQDAIRELDRLSDKKAIPKLINSSEDTVASKLHFSLGRWMNIHWGLEEGSRLSHHLKSRGMSYPDDMIDFLIRIWHRHLTKKSWEEEQLIQAYIAKRRLEYFKKFIQIDTLSLRFKKQ